MQTIIDDILLNYQISGVNQKATILILHGWGRSMHDWANIANILSDKYRVITLDFPGFGESSIPTTPFNTLDYAKIVDKFINKLNLKNLILMGHSFGGKTSIIIASQSPEIEKLILIDASGVEKKSFTTQLKHFVYKLIKPFRILMPPYLQERIFPLFASNDYMNAGKLRDSFKQIVNQDVSEYADRIKSPTLIIWGDNDQEVSIQSGLTLRKLIQNSRLRIVWGAGHDPHREKPNKFMEIISEYLK